MRWTAVVALMLLAPVSCGDPYEPAVLAELCGVAAPVRVLELAPDRAMAGRPFTLGDRLYYAIGRPEPRSDTLNTEFMDLALWSTGPCGESPRRIADGVQSPFELERWPGLVFGCHKERGDILLLDPGGAEPQVAFAGVDCGVRWTDHGLLSLAKHDDEVSADLLLHPYPDDPRDGSTTPTVPLLNDILLDPGSSLGVRLTKDAVRAVSRDGELLRVDMVDLSVTVEQTDVRDFDVSEDGRYLVWRSRTVTGGEPDRPTGVVSLRDQSEGASVSLGNSRFAVHSYGLRWADQGLLVYGVLAEQRIYFLDDLSFVDLPPGLGIDFAGPSGGKYWLLQNYWDGSWLHVLDLEDRSVTPLLAAQGSVREREPDGVLVLDAPPCCLNGDGRDEGSLLFLPYDGSPGSRVGGPATGNSYRPDPTRLVTALDIGGDNRGTLALIDLATGDGRSIDDHVFISYTSSRFGSDPTMLAYSVMDGARSGVWRARLPAAP